MMRRLLGRAPAVGRDAIVWAYRLFLDREPESKATIDQYAAALTSSADIRRELDLRYSVGCTPGPVDRQSSPCS